MLLLVGLGPTMDFSYILGRVWSNRVNASYLSTVILGNRMIKYADDTYIVIPAGNIQSRVIEFEHVADWAQKNNLKLSRAKSVVIVINDIRKKSHFTVPPILPDICRVTSIKVLGVTFTIDICLSVNMSVT